MLCFGDELSGLPLAKGRDGEMFASVLLACRGPLFISTHHRTCDQKDGTTFPQVACKCWFLLKISRISRRSPFPRAPGPRIG